MVVTGNKPPLDVTVLTGPPGCRKTTRMREEAIAQPGLYLFSMPTHALIDEQVVAFRKAAPLLPVYPIHADIKPNRRIDRQIEDALQEIRSASHRHAVVMLTHTSLMAKDLSGFSGWHARIDEAPNGVDSGHVTFKGTEALYAELFTLDPVADTGWSTLKPTGPRPNYFAMKSNPSLAPIEEFIRLAYRPNGVFVNAASYSDIKKKVGWWSIWTPGSLKDFASVQIAGASYDTSLGAKVLKNWFPNSVRLTAISLDMKRSGNPSIKIHYFTDSHRPSSRLWSQSEGRKRLKAVADWLENNATHIEYWSGNSEVLKLLDWRVAGEPIKPRVAGLNKWRDYKACAFIYSSQKTPDDQPLQDIFGITDDDIRIAREDEDILQFVMRGALRNPEYDGIYDIYLYSKEQAERLSDKLAASQVGTIELIPVHDAGIMDSPELRQPETQRSQKKAKTVHLSDGSVIQAKSHRRRQLRAEKAKQEGRVPGRRGRPRKKL
ncbi:hypothetical protein HMPREF0185_00001 [Brevundimonas diminuta 470-4]|nr:hypothetical protein HMPREF0185_00001 [Brevundimonas diminuta 470-4]